MILQNVVPYEQSISIVLKEEENFLTDLNGFCIWIPKEYKRDKIEIEYKYIHTYEEIPEGALLFKTSEFTIGNYSDDFFNTIEYDKSNDIYKMIIDNKEEFNNLVKKLDINFDNTIDDSTIDNKEMLFIFKKNTSNLKFVKISRDENYTISLTLGEILDNNNVMTGFIFIVDKNEVKDYKVIIKEYDELN